MSYPVPTIKLIQSALFKQGLTSPFIQAGILAVVSTEGSFTPKSESNYSNTPNDRLRLLFGKRLARLDEIALDKLKKNDEAFFDAIYGGVNGNTAAGDGWKYRGRGFNQITFRATYEKASQWSGVDLISFPDRLNEPQIASDSLAGFFADGLKNHKPNEVKNLEEGCTLAFRLNAGFGADISRGWLKTEHEHQMKNIVELYGIISPNL